MIKTLEELSLTKGEYGGGFSAVDYSEDKPRYIRITDIKEGGELKKDTKSPSGTEKDWKKYKLVEGDILFARSGATVGKTFLYEEKYGDCIYAGYLIRFKPNTKIAYPKYVYYYTRTPKYNAWVLNKQNVVAQPNINAKQYGTELKIPLPPLPTQKKIAAILDAADAYRQKTKALIEKYDELTQSLFLDMFGDPVVNEKGWEIKTIGECFNVKGGKRLPKGTEYESKPTQYAYIRVTDFVKNGLEISDIKYINKDIHDKISRYVISSNDVYISIAGTIGLAGFVPEFLSGSNLTENAAKITSKENTKYRREYLSFYLNSDYAQQHIKSKTMAVGVPKLALFRIKELPYINAPEKVQSLFVKRVQKIEAQKAQAQESLEKAEELFNSLLGRAFKGEI